MTNEIFWKKRDEYLKKEVFVRPGELRLSSLTQEQRQAVIDYLIYQILSNENFKIELLGDLLKVITEIPVSDVSVK